MAKRILVVDDDPSIVRIVRSYLQQAGYEVLTAADGDRVLQLVRHERPDLVVLDIMLPRRDGWEITRSIRADATIAAMPIILLTARVEDSDKIVGLELGADDYITKPFNAHEVVARVRALLRRSQLAQGGSSARVLSAGGLRLDLDQCTLTVDGVDVDVTRTELKLLQLFMEHPGHTLTRDELLEKVIGYAYEGMGRTLDTHIRNLRKKIEPDPNTPHYIQTVYGIGYRMIRRVTMLPLWVRLSLYISGLLLAGIMATAVIGVDQSRERLPAAQNEAVPGTSISLRRAGAVTFVGITSILIGVLVSRSISAPITQLAAAARRIGAGELRTQVHVGGSRELVELAQAFNTMAADLQHAEVLRANLMADVSHELRTPLTALEGNLRAALDRVYALDEVEIANLYSQTQHLIRLVNDLRELALADARQLPLHKQPVDLTELVDETLLVFAPLAEEQTVCLERHLDNLPAIRVDAVRIRQVMHNLLSNALRHTPSGGTVSIMGRRVLGGVSIAVVDTGSGLAADQLELVFDRFYRSDRSRSRDTGGTGLGLAIVKAIVEAHDGRVAAQSKGFGEGCSFTIFLPER